MLKKNKVFYTTIFLNDLKHPYGFWWVNLNVNRNFEFQFVQSEQVEGHSSFLEPVNLGLRLAVFNFLPIFSLYFVLDVLKILRASMSILAAMFVTLFNSISLSA